MKYPKEIRCPDCGKSRLIDYRCLWAIKKNNGSGRCFKCSRWKKGEVTWVKKGRTPWNKGKHHTLEQIENLRLAWVRRRELGHNVHTTLGRKYPFKKRGRRPDVAGERSRFWKGGTTSLLAKMRTSPEYKEWRASVFRRDAWTCVLGGREHGHKIHADHIKSFATHPDLRYNIDNGRTLCVDCHRKTDTYLNRWVVNKK